MFDYAAYLTAQARTAELTRGARPEDPVRPDAAAAGLPGAVGGIRHAVGAAVRRFADRLEPSPAGRIDPVADCGR